LLHNSHAHEFLVKKGSDKLNSEMLSHW
jgi:hypothetical protein